MLSVPLFGPPSFVVGGPEGTGMQWRITIVSSLTRTSLTTRRTIPLPLHDVERLGRRSQTREKCRQGLGQAQMGGALASLLDQRVQLVP